MLDFLSENLATLLVAAIVAAVLALIVVRMVSSHKKGASCGPACSCCPNAAACHACKPAPQDRR